MEKNPSARIQAFVIIEEDVRMAQRHENVKSYIVLESFEPSYRVQAFMYLVRLDYEFRNLLFILVEYVRSQKPVLGYETVE